MNEGDDPHLQLTVRAPQGVDLVDTLYARGPTTFAELVPIVTLWFFSGRSRGELGAFTSAPTGIPSIVSGQRFVGFWEYERRVLQETPEHQTREPRRLWWCR